MVPFRLAAAWLAWSVVSVRAQGDSLFQQYCSNENTGLNYQAVYNIYQSNGACHDQCKDNYAFAVVQWQDCWCSNYIPAEQQSEQHACPFYYDSAINSAVKHTPGDLDDPAVQHATGHVFLAASGYQHNIRLFSTTILIPELGSAVISNDDIIGPADVIRLTNINTPPPQSATPVPSLRVVTLSGAIITQTVTSTPLVAPTSAADLQFLQRHHLSPGAIAGLVIGILLALALLAILAFLLLRRRKQARDTELAAAGIAPAGGGPTSPRRNISVLSRTGLLSRGGRPTSMAETHTYDDAGGALGIHTGGQNSVRHSMLFGGVAGGIGGVVGGGVSPVSPLGSTHDEHDGSRRYSRPMVYDQRLNPSALFANAEGNGSRVSMQDQRDYSRALGVVNPDVEVGRGSFESRVS
ncbi:hypothetical protein B0A54_03909 [Friedmanniomyces endolithicus]|uniref:WSC domain-containing protein n=1 Tax=Friedmanniomyces endolithicus TaxID=329885 RepID=A0A4U0VDM4_9PEZI|nr:hypothetical protein B0A54_03909 [Friedmanniomyces endolithicus]